MPAPADTLILNAGGLRSLVALAGHRAAHDRKPALLYVHDGRDADQPRFEHAHRQADFFGIAKLHELKLPHLYGSRIQRAADGAAVSPLSTPQLLLAAAQHARRLGANSLIWPAARGHDPAGLALAAEHAILVQHLIETEPAADDATNPDAPGFRILTPLLELTPPQLLQRGQRADANFALAWTCLLGQPSPCGACAGCRTRRRAFDTARVLDPLEPSPVAA